jgi:thioredoxin 1
MLAMQDQTPAAPAATAHLACLCAAWCRTCDAYRAVFEDQAQALRQQGLQVHAHWVDIEDEAELVGDLDIETFPTLLVSVGEELRFAGVLTPQPQTLQRVLRAALDEGALALPNSPFADIAARLRHYPVLSSNSQEPT